MRGSLRPPAQNAVTGAQWYIRRRVKEKTHRYQWALSLASVWGYPINRSNPLCSSLIRPIAFAASSEHSAMSNQTITSVATLADTGTYIPGQLPTDSSLMNRLLVLRQSSRIVAGGIGSPICSWAGSHACKLPVHEPAEPELQMRHRVSNILVTLSIAVLAHDCQFIVERCRCLVADHLCKPLERYEQHRITCVLVEHAPLTEPIT